MLKTLYKKTSTGKIQQWKVRVEGNIILSESGQVDGKMIKSKDIIKEGKNAGKTNETSKEQQAENKEQAIRTAIDQFHIWSDKNQCWMFGKDKTDHRTWALPKDLQCVLIGEALNKNKVNGLILASFNAG